MAGRKRRGCRLGTDAFPESLFLLGVIGIALVSPALSAAPAGAADAYDRISFGVDSEREVANDRVTAILAVTGEDEDPARLADRINRTMAWALERARAEEEVRVRSGGYRTDPVYRDHRIRRWRGRQTLVLEGTDAVAVGRLVGELQSRLQVQSMVFSVSPDQRRAAEEQLVEEALAAFQERAARVAAALGAAGYRIVSIDVAAQGRQPVRPLRVEGKALTSSGGVRPPALEAGTSRVRVEARGTIELLRTAP